MRLLRAAPMVFLMACVTPTQERDPELIVDDRLPAWLGAPAGVARAAELEETAALLCARDTDGVIDNDVRAATGLADGQVLGLIERDAREDRAIQRLAARAALLLDEKRATHAGVVVGRTPAGVPCAALVAVRRLLVLGARPASQLPSGAPLSLSWRLPRGKTATLYVLKPDGFVDVFPLGDAHAPPTLNIPSSAGDGQYVAEVVVDGGGEKPDPEVAMLWPYVVGRAKAPPYPEVLFPDEGHDDTALTHRAEALLQRLRNEQLIEPFKLSPVLIEISRSRATALSQGGALGHRLPGGRDVLDEIRARFAGDKRASFVRLAEVQAQASTLAEAWHALLESPAHRKELVDASFTHAGVAVVRGADAAGRPTLTMVALLARRPPAREPDEVRALFVQRVNSARDAYGLDPLRESAHLHRLAARLAGAMSENGRVDDTLLGGPIGKIALEEDGSLTRVKPLVARVDDPLLLVDNTVPPLLMNIDAAQVGVGLALHPEEGVFYVCVLVGE